MKAIVNLSPGSLIALWKLIQLAKAHPRIPIKSAINAARDSGLLAGDLPAAHGLELGCRHDFLEIINGELCITYFCETRFLSKIGDINTEITTTTKRLILHKVITDQNFEWLLYFHEDPDIFKVLIPRDWSMILESCDLLNFADAIVVDWWKSVFSKYQKFKEGQKVQIGNLGEKLSYDFEKQRLTNDGISNHEYYLKWVSQIGDRFGFDILSIRSAYLSFESNSKEPIQIEVKSQLATDFRNFRFYISKGEWLKATENLDSYFFYCWLSIDLIAEYGKGPFIVPAKMIQTYVPQDSNSICQWSECRVVIDLNKFSINYDLLGNAFDVS